MFGIFSKKRVYADAAAATPLSPRVQKELIRLLSLYGNPGSLHKEAVEAQRELNRARESIAESLGAHADEIVCTGSGTEANNLALQGVVRPLLAKHGEVAALRSAIEHQSVLEPLRALEREGLNVVAVGVDAQGLIDPKQVAELISDETVLVSIQMVNSEVGTIEPIKEIAKVVRAVRKTRAAQKDALPIFLHTDAAQTPLWMDIRVDSLGVDLLTVDAQKVLGPKGVGVLYVRRGTPLEPLLWGGMQESGLRAGTENLPLVGTFAVALADAQKNCAAHTAHTISVRDFLIFGIKKAFPNVVVHGAAGKDRIANNVNISIPGLDGEMAVVALDREGIAAATRSACSTGEEGISHVMEALGVGSEVAKGAMRITLLPTATKGDAQAIIRALVRIAKVYRRVV